MHISKKQLIEFLQQSEHFEGVSCEQLETLLGCSKTFQLGSRKPLLRQNETSEKVFILLEGQLRFRKLNAEGRVSALGEFFAGQMVGEISLLKEGLNVATVFAAKTSWILEIERKEFRSFLNRNPRVLHSIVKKIILLADRNLTEAPIKPRYSSFAVIPLFEDKNFLETFVSKFSMTLTRFGRAEQVASEEGLRRVENQGHDYLIYKSGFQYNEWSKRCLLDADRIVFIARLDQGVEKTLLEHKFKELQNEFSAKSELVFLSDTKESKGSVQSFLQIRSVERRHHVQLKNQLDFDRLLRVLTGNSIALALGGGGVRAASQVGVLKVFQEEKIPIDFVAGTSIGALVGALFAQGRSAEEMENIILEEVVQGGLFGDYTFPFVSMVRGRRYSQFLKKIFGEAVIEDMPIAYSAAVTNLGKGSLELWEEGELWQAVRASASLPAVLTPVTRYGEVYVDGGLLNNLPADELKKKGAGKVISIDVSSFVDLSCDENLGNIVQSPGVAPSFARAFYNKFFNKSKKYTSIADIIARSMVVGSHSKLEKSKKSSDLYIKVPADKYAMLDFKNTSKIFNLGYHFAKENISEWKKSL